jgi:replicative DNA helicase
MSAQGVPPPHDLAAETTVVSAALLLGPEVLDELGALVRPADCYAPAHALVLEAAHAIHEAGGAVDLVSVARWLQERGKLERVIDPGNAELRGSAYLARITDVTPAVANWQEHARAVRRLARQRGLIEFSNAIRAKAFAPVEDVDRLLSEVEALALDATRSEGTGAITSVTLDEALEPHRIVLRADPGAAPAIPAIGTGLASVDARYGATPRGEMLLLGGRPGTGKTAFALQMALYGARAGQGVGFVSAEMRRSQLSARLLCQATEINSTNLRRGTCSQDERRLLLRGANEIGRLPFLIDDQRFPSLSQIRRAARRMATRLRDEYRTPLRLLFVDHFHRLNHEQRHGENETQAMGRTVLGLSTLAAELDAVIVVLAQLNRQSDARGNKDSRPRMSDFKGCGAIEENAFLGLLLYRPEMLSPGESPGVCEVIGGKVRDGGEIGIVHVGFDGPTTRFYDLQTQRRDEFDGDFDRGF